MAIELKEPQTDVHAFFNEQLRIASGKERSVASVSLNAHNITDGNLQGVSTLEHARLQRLMAFEGGVSAN